jgi:hypothetical protein
VSLEFREGRIDSGEGRVLERAMADEMHALYDGLVFDGADMPAAGQHLYESAGYAAVANFNGNPVATFWGEKRLR